MLTAQASHGLEGMVRLSDFRSTLTGALVLREGDGALLYNLDTQEAAQRRVLAPYFSVSGDTLLPYNHLPFEAMFVSPLMDLPYPVVFLIWSLLLAIAVWLALALMYSALPIRGHVLASVVLLFLSYQPLFRAFTLGQNSPLVLLGLCGTYAAVKRGHPMWAGVALLLVALKPQVLPVILLLLLLQARWKTLLAFAASLGALCLAAIPVLGTDWPIQYVRLLVGVANWQQAGAIDASIMHNWRGFATNLFGTWAPGLVTPIFMVLSVASVGLLAWAWMRTRPTRTSGGTSVPQSIGGQDLVWALAGILAVLTSLHLNPHDLTLLLFPTWIICSYALSGRWSKDFSRFLLSILLAGYGLVLLASYLGVMASQPGLFVVPSVSLMALTALLLVSQLSTRQRVTSDQ